jgi:membrane fusion protein (multidrug efflux system)
MVGQYHEVTENASVSGNVVAINAQTTGTVEAIFAEENQEVVAGQELVKLSPTDAQVALSQATAQLAEVTRQVQQAFNNTGVTAAQVNQATTAVNTAADAVKRRAPLVATGAVSKEEFANAKDALARAQSALQVAQAQNRSAKAQVSGTDISHHPSVERAKAAFRAAFINEKRLAVIAPMSGIVAKRYAQVGQTVAPNVPLMNLVAANEVWVDANFKETQLKNLRIGQPVTLKADAYGKVTYSGKIQGIAMSTGSAASILPAQNATGNWIKIVQRVPVRIALTNPDELKTAPLRFGLSMTVDVDTHNRDGQLLGAGELSLGNLSTNVYAQDEQEAEDAAMKIISDNQ